MRQREAVAWRASVKRMLEPVDCHAVCPSGTLVVALLQLGVPLSEQADSVCVTVEALRGTVAPGALRGRAARARYVPTCQDTLGDGTVQRLAALVGVVVALRLGDAASALAEADAWGVGVGTRVPGLGARGGSGGGAWYQRPGGPPPVAGRG